MKLSLFVYILARNMSTCSEVVKYIQTCDDIFQHLEAVHCEAGIMMQRY